MIFYEKTIESTFEAVDQLVVEIMVKLEHNFTQISKHILFNINFMMREILNNAVEHGNHFSSEKMVYCKTLYEAPIFAFIIKDEGLGINFEQVAMDKNDKNTLLRERQRGYQTLREMDFDIKVKDNEVTVLLNLDQEVRLWKNNY